MAVIELTRYSSAPGQEGSGAEKHGRTKVFLVCLVAELRKKRWGGRGVKVGDRKGKKGGETGRKVNTLNKNFIKFSEWFL